MKRPTPAPAGQQGMAIISALLIAAVVAVIAGGMLNRQTLFTRSLEAEQQRVQGTWRLLGAVELSRQVLRDARLQEAATRLDQPWARPIVLQQGAGPFAGQLQDEQGKFNLRNLMANQRPDPQELQNFERLCQLLGVSPAVGQRISQRVINAYPRVAKREPVPAAPVSPGARATSPNAPAKHERAQYSMLRSLDDLRGVEGVDDALLARLAPYLTILPANTWVNGNTASATVLAAVVPGLSLARAQGLIAERDSGQWFINRGEFVNRLRMPHLVVDDVRVGITSEWFRLRGQARSDRRRVSLDVLLYRSEEAMPRVIWSRVGV